MKSLSIQRSLLVFILSLLLCCFAAEAALKQKKAHGKRMRGANSKGIVHHGEFAGKDEVQKGANEDDASDSADDDDDDDDDDDEEDAPAAKTVSLKAHSQAVDAHAAEEAKLKKALAAKEEELASNLKEQAALKQDFAYLKDVAKSNSEIDAEAKVVANETDSKAMASMLGKMWKEMRMFEMPSYEKHVEAELRHLKLEEKRLEQDVEASQAKLTAARAKWAKEGKGEKADVEAAEPAVVEAKPEKAEEEAKPKKEKKAANVQANEAVAQEGTLHKWSFWHMAPKQQKAVFVSTLGYLVSGILLALLYVKARGKTAPYAAVFMPKPMKKETGRQDRPQGEFSNSLFGCLTDPNLCVVGCCCPMIRWADTMDRTGLMTYWKAFFVMFILALLHPYTLAITTVIVWVVGTAYRQKLRAHYGIEKGGKTVVADLFAWVCCQCCAVIQEAREEAATDLDKLRP
jgi:Cys-rich protein (TIGR01571 family)